MKLWYIFRKKRRIIYLFLIIVFLFTFNQSYFDESVIEYVKVKTKYFYEENIINVLSQSLSEDDLIKLKYDDYGNITYAYLDVLKTQNIRINSSLKLNELSKNLEEELDYIKIPIGYSFTKKFFFSDGMKVPIKLKVYNAYETEIESNVIDFGINNQLYEIYLNIKVEIYVQIPLQSEIIQLNNNILLCSGILNNDIPNYYFTLS